MSIWVDIHRRSNGLQVRQEDTVQDGLDYFHINVSGEGEIKELTLRIRELEKEMKKLTKINKLYYEHLDRHTQEEYR